ncbi:MerR family transcriptional regulator (plasmid) [Actinacidiphila glaucinigra]|uniref:MerR family transcriptional regulator n=1 Tax=Actinacidiphila glaucinigra TaxID=235986 RepID=UPI002DDAAF1E|nr:MerR family transcriptional regulator [Actinacidiphila glaucinigra]WSD65786.1 MerR family transcriptional regulator [Actinacidiphila glaucinigra]
MGTVLLSIGDFARMTYLSVKSLRHYHDIGLLEPADVDPATGYRRYSPDQVPLAQVVRRFRDLGMPLEELSAVVHAPDVASRKAVILQHLERVEEQLRQTQETVTSLRNLLDNPPSRVPVEFRSTPPTAVLAVRAVLDQELVPRWLSQALAEIHEAIVACPQVAAAGSEGALYAPALFETERGEVTAFVPVTGAMQTAVAGRVEALVLPAAEYAVAVHIGPAQDLDQTFAALGTFVAEHAISVEAPLREHYLRGGLDARTESKTYIEVCWPVFRTSDAGGGPVSLTPRV